MDVHRCRFVPYPAFEINALAFSHQSRPNEPTPPQLRLALGRSNGDIEIWNPLGRTWIQETILRGGKGRTIEGLAWTQDPEWQTPEGKKMAGKLRLFSIGYSPVVTEWDLATGRPARQCGGSYGDVWSIAAQPLPDSKFSKRAKKDKALPPVATAQEAYQEQYLALGCADGSVVLLSTAGGDLAYVKTLPRSSGKNAGILSLAWNGRHEILAGFSDGMIRVYTIAERGQQKASMSVGITGNSAAGRGSSRKTLVWDIKMLRDGTFVSADSTGEIKIWDADNYTMLQRLKGHLSADALSLATSHDGSVILSGGIDRRTVFYQKTQPEGVKQRDRWAAVHHQRYHQGDVKVMATFESKNMSVVVSGGIDTVPIVNPLKTFGQEFHRSLPAMASAPVVKSAPKARLMVSWWEKEVSIWHVPSRNTSSDANRDNPTKDDDEPVTKLVAKIALKAEEWITDANISAMGDCIAVSTISATKVFHLRLSKTSRMMRIQKIELPNAAAVRGAKVVRFSPDGKWLASCLPDNSIQYLRFVRDGEVKQPYRVLDTTVEFERQHGRSSQRVAWGTHGKYDHVVSRMAWSSDSRILLAGDITGNLDTFVLEGNEDPDWTGEIKVNGTSKRAAGDESSDDESEDEEQPEVIFGQHWKRHTGRLPVLPSAPLVLSFRPETDQGSQTKGQVNGNAGLHPTRHRPVPHSHELPHSEDRVLIVTAKHEVLEFHALSGKMTEWSKRNDLKALPLAFRNVLDRAMDCVWDAQGGRERVFLYGTSWVWMFDLSRDLPVPVQSQTQALNESNPFKRKRELSDLETRELIRNNAGAGSKIHDKEVGSGVGAQLSVQSGPKMKAISSLTFNANAPLKLSQATGNQDSDDDDDEEFDDFGAFPQDEEDDDDEDDDEEEEANGQSTALIQIRRKAKKNSKGDLVASVGTSNPHDWHTFKYRSILGIVPLLDEAASDDEGAGGAGMGEDGEGEGSSEKRGIEVAIVERPLWDADLAPRWEGPQEWGER